MKSTRLTLISFVVLLALPGCSHPRPSEDDVLNVTAKIPANLPVPAMDWRVISTSVNRTDKTTATLTGNDLAVKYSATGVYPEGSKLALMTWFERDDPHWFGARIPGTFVALETISVDRDPTRGPDRDSAGKIVATYKRYTGDPLREVTGSTNADARKAIILAMQPSPMP